MCREVWEGPLGVSHLESQRGRSGSVNFVPGQYWEVLLFAVLTCKHHHRPISDTCFSGVCGIPHLLAQQSKSTCGCSPGAVAPNSTSHHNLRRKGRALLRGHLGALWIQLAHPGRCVARSGGGGRNFPFARPVAGCFRIGSVLVIFQAKGYMDFMFN